MNKINHPRHWTLKTCPMFRDGCVERHNHDIDEMFNDAAAQSLLAKLRESALQEEVDKLTAQLKAALDANRKLIAEKNAKTFGIAITPDDPRYAELAARMHPGAGDEECKPTAFDRERFVRIAKDQLDQIINAIKEIRP